MSEKIIRKYNCTDVNGRTFSIMTDETVDAAWIAKQNESRAKFGTGGRSAAIVTCVPADSL